MKLILILLFLPGTGLGGINISLPDQELNILSYVADKYELTTEQRYLLFAIRAVEAGRPGREMGVLDPRAMRYTDGVVSLLVQGEWAARTIKRRYRGDLPAFAAIYCPIGVANDPTGLNKYWLPGVRRTLKRWGVK